METSLKSLKAGDDLNVIGDRPVNSCLVVSGVIQRYKTSLEGRRCVLSLHYPGDMPDLQSLGLDTMDQSLQAVVPSRIVSIRHDELRAVMASHPRVAQTLWVIAMIEASVSRQWSFIIAAASAEQRVAHLICETYLRLKTVELAKNNTFTMLLTQSNVADMTGMSTVHVNRVMQSLKQRRLFRSKGREITILDWDALQKAAEFDSAYLRLPQMGRLSVE